MELKAFFKALEEMMELPAGSLRGDAELAATEKWDSMMILNFIALVDEQFSFSVEPEKIADCVTANDLVALLGDRIH